jgi:ribonuclease P protein component
MSRPGGVRVGGGKLTSNADFQRVYDGGRSWVSREVIVRALPSGLDATRCGFTVGRRIGKAVVRNRIKRRLREILRHFPLPVGWDIIVIARAPAARTDFHNLKSTVRDLLSKAGLLVEENENAGSGID